MFAHRTFSWDKILWVPYRVIAGRRNMSVDVVTIAQYLTNGIFLFSVYGLVAVGLTLIFGILEVVNFAHGEFYMLSAYIAYVFFVVLGLNYVAAVVAAVVILAAFGIVVNKTLILPVFERSFQAAIITTLGLSMIMQNSVLVVAGATPLALNLSWSNQPISIFGVFLTYQKVLILGTSVLAFLLLNVFVKQTKMGKAMRAVSQNKEACAVVGIDIRRIAMITFAVGAGITAIAGALVAPLFIISPTMGAPLTLKAFAIVIAGGMGNVIGGIYMAFIVGMSESILGAFYPEYVNGISFAILIGVLMLRPEGLLGRKIGI